jgi:hypothetical protein
VRALAAPRAKRPAVKRLIFALLAVASTAGTAAAGQLDAHIMAQPDAPVRIVGCSAEQYTMRNGSNVTESASFEATGPKTATAVRVGFAFFDVLGARFIHSGLTSGTFTPGARIDVKAFAGRIGAETRGVVCFVLQAAFDDGTTWVQPAAGFPLNAQASVVEAPPIPTSILPQDGSPVRLDTCSLYGPREEIVSTRLVLTNLSEKRVSRVDVDYVFYDASKASAPHDEWMRGDYAPGATIKGSIQMRVPGGSVAKVYCAVSRATFADGTQWRAGPNFLAGAVPP